MNGNDASQDLRQLTSQNLKTASCWEGEETEREEFLKGKFLTPVFQYKGTGQFVMNIFTRVSKKPRGRAAVLPAPKVSRMYCCIRAQ